ncbi:unnamed protein product [Sphenostylis stenocarpa]|uniref:Uncharacterized protein n=1 Tax=Sphenostylis stenocarpa TaxID=92480 RepID=A0AA86SPJ0_9FABA|nr:unnamed protein product [Sphenostylis stenocarpa]
MKGRAPPIYRDSRLSGRDRRLVWRDGGIDLPKDERVVSPNKMASRLAIQRDDNPEKRDGDLEKRDGSLDPIRWESLFFVQKNLRSLIWGQIVSPSGFLGLPHLRFGGLLLFILRSGKIWGLLADCWPAVPRRSAGG